MTHTVCIIRLQPWLGKIGKLGGRHTSTYGSPPPQTAVVVVLQTRATGLVFICTPRITVLYFIRIKYDANDINDVRTGRAAGSRRYNADRHRRTDLSHRPTCTYVNIIIIIITIHANTRDSRCICAAYYCTQCCIRVRHNIIMHIKICTAVCHYNNILLLLLLLLLLSL